MSVKKKPIVTALFLLLIVLLSTKNLFNGFIAWTGMHFEGTGSKARKIHRNTACFEPR